MGSRVQPEAQPTGRATDTPPTETLQTQPAPSSVLTDPDPVDHVALEKPSWLDAPSDDQLSDDGDDPDAELDGLLDDELLARVEDLFAGRVGVSWRRAYPLRQRTATAHNRRERRWQ
jgi:hypothetical protein